MKESTHHFDALEPVDGNSAEELKRNFENTHPGLVAEYLETLPLDKCWLLLEKMSAARRTAVFSHLSVDDKLELLASLNLQDAAQLLTSLPPDDRADLLKRMAEDLRDRILSTLAPVEREDARRLTGYEEGTVGSVMSSDYATLDPGLSAAEGIHQLRIEASDKETIDCAYILDPSHRLLGFVSLRDLVMANPDEKLSAFMHYDTICARVDEDQERAARRLQKYELIVMPVLDTNGVLVGILTHDDAFDIIIQAQTEDMEKLVAISGMHEAGVYLKTSPWKHFKNRVFWITALAFVGIISGVIVQRSEAMLVLLPILAVFMPMLVDTGGNTGSQSSTLVVRGIALQEIRPEDLWRVLAKELQVSVLLAIILASIAFSRVFFFGGSQILPDGVTLLRVGSAIALALGLQVISATLIGALLPMMASRLKLDPAVVASPALTTIVDITGLLLYFSIAKVVIG